MINKQELEQVKKVLKILKNHALLEDLYIKEFSVIEIEEALTTALKYLDRVGELEETLDNIDAEVSKVYCYITDGKLSKPTYTAQVMIAEVDDMCNRVVEEETKELQAEIARLKEGLPDTEELWDIITSYDNLMDSATAIHNRLHKEKK